jgi:hypothetical protein
MCPVAVGVQICADGEAIDEAILVPKVIDHADPALMVRLAMPRRPIDKRPAILRFPS